MSHPHPELSAPAPLPKGGLRVTPLGGLGEVGRNMTVFEYDGRLLVVDCGVLFPEEHHPGVDLILPDFDAIRDRLDAVEALVLTHGHEDHIGATPYLLRERGDIPLVGSELTLALLGLKLREHRLKETVHHVVARGRPDQLRPVRPGVRRGQPLDPRRARGRDPHRRPGWCCTPATSRWTSCRWTAGSPTCAPSPGWGRRGSTCSSPTPPTPRCPASPPRRSTSRRCSTGSSTRASSGSSWPASPRTCTGSSRSSTRRRPTAARSPTSAGRWCATWRSPRTSATSRVPPGVMVDAKELADLPPERQVLISTGSQGEPMSALSRIAQRNHHFVHIEEGDTVVLASSLIPGNENAVYRVINGLARWGATRRAQGQRPGPRERPRERRRAALLLQHRPAAQRAARCTARSGTCWPTPRSPGPTGVPAENVVIAEDGVVVDLVDGRGPDRRQGRLRLRLRRRVVGRRHHRVLAQGPPDPRRGGLHLGRSWWSTR